MRPLLSAIPLQVFRSFGGAPATMSTNRGIWPKNPSANRIVEVAHGETWRPKTLDAIHVATAETLGAELTAMIAYHGKMASLQSRGLALASDGEAAVYEFGPERTEWAGSELGRILRVVVEFGARDCGLRHRDRVVSQHRLGDL